MKKLKELVDELHLEKFYDDFQRNDDSYKYIVELYAYTVNDVTYIGNRQIPKTDNSDYTNVKYSTAEYWLNGDCDIFTVLYRYDGTSNSLYDPETQTGNKLANQHLLNDIKKLIIDYVKSNFNIQILPEGYDIIDQIGKQISDWKKKITSKLRLYDIVEFIDDLQIILESIKKNPLYWHKYLITKNRFWFISMYENDIEERRNIMFDSFNNDQKAVIIVMKEWLAMIINESHINPSYNMHIDNVLYKLRNGHYMNIKLFEDSKSKFFSHKTCIKLILSTMYANSTEMQIEQVYKKFMKWRETYNTIIFNR